MYSNINLFPSSSSSSTTTATTAQPPFKAPAHKHAYHLHSIPPREKSTRTLIIDHMLWVHARTRFAQARAELGMTDRTGGPNTLNYAHRRRPENYEEEDEHGSEGEDVSVLLSRVGGTDDEDDLLANQDLTLARNLRLRAEGLEKVVTSMLEQPPPIHPINDEDILTPPTSPRTIPNHTHINDAHPHTLPNGVRLRLALGTIINDLFARQAPHPPYRHTHPPVPKMTTPPDHSPSSPPSLSSLPEALTPLAPISGAFSPRTPTHPLYPYTPRPSPGPRTRSLYTAGADPSTANSPPAFRCPRHLHTGCDICVEAKSPTRPSPSSSASRAARSHAPSSSSFSSSSPDRSGNRSASSWGTTNGVGISGWQDGSGIGSGLLKPGVRGSALRRKVGNVDCGAQGNEDGGAQSQSTGAGNTKLSKLLPRFLRLSALVALELGEEAAQRREEEEEEENGSRDGSEREGFEHALGPTREWYMLLAGLLTRAVLEGYLTAGWLGLQAMECLLLVGLGEGTKGGEGREDEDEDEDGDGEAGFEEFDPDELPSLVEAVKILFPALRDGAGKGTAEQEFETEMYERLRRFYDIPASTPDLSTHMEDLAWQYPAEPVERAAVRFCEAIAKWRGKPELETYKKRPSNDSDSYSMHNSPFTGETPGSAMTIESLVHSNPTSPTMPNARAHSMMGGNVFAATRVLTRRTARKPSIDVYFSAPPVLYGDEGVLRGNKRGREDDEGRVGGAKRVQVS